ncbi:unnamed protein product, partial [Symbiodinium microadriaticum]
LPSLPAPPEVLSDTRGTGLRVEGDSVAHDTGAGQGAIGGRSEGREGFEWFYDGLKRVFASHNGEQDGRAEEVKTSTAELQKLVINDGDKNVSPLLAGDWLTLAGLRLILKAIPNSLKEELVSTQRMSCIDAVAKAELEVLDTGVAKGTKAARLKGSEEQPKGDAGAAVGAAQTAAKVALAEGETYMGVSAFDTLIGSVDSEPIVSMSKLVRLGFHVAWRQKTCAVVHPTLGRVPVVVQDGCPRVDRRVALDLIARIEQWENDAGQQSTMNAEGVALIHEAMQGMGVADYAEGLCRAIDVDDGGEGIIAAWTEALLKTMYPAVLNNVCDEVSRFLPGRHEALCWNRRKRRSMHRSKGVILNLCCGNSRRQFQQTAARYGFRFQVVDVDVKENLNSPHTMAYLGK